MSRNDRLRHALDRAVLAGFIRTHYHHGGDGALRWVVDDHVYTTREAEAFVAGIEAASRRRVQR